MSTLATPKPGVKGRRVRALSQRRSPPLITMLGAAIAAALVLLPLVFLVVQAQQSGWGVVSRILFRHETAILLVEHPAPGGCMHGPVRGHRGGFRMVRRANCDPRSPRVGGAAGVAARGPRFRRRLRLGVA